jgi:hypothetical protein
MASDKLRCFIIDEHPNPVIAHLLKLDPRAVVIVYFDIERPARISSWAALKDAENGSVVSSGNYRLILVHHGVHVGWDVDVVGSHVEPRHRSQRRCRSETRSIGSSWS